MFGEEAPISHPASRIPDVPAWTEHERLTREKAVLGFFISGHPLAKYGTEVELFGTRTTATLGMWSPQKVTVAGNRSEEHTSELQSRVDLVCRLLLEKKKEQR